MRLYMRYQADIWVEVDTESEDVVAVTVEELTMAEAVDVFAEEGRPVPQEHRVRAQVVAGSQEWPSWDYGGRPL